MDSYIPLIVNFLGADIDSLLDTATDLATTATSTATQVADGLEAHASVESGSEGGVQVVQEQVESIDAHDIEVAGRNVSGAA